MEAKNNIDKTKEQINLLTSIDTAARNLQHVNQEIRQLEHEKEIAAYWFASRIIFLSEEKNRSTRQRFGYKKKNSTNCKCS